MKPWFLLITVFLFSCENENNLAEKLDESITIPPVTNLSVVDNIAMWNRVDGPFVGIGAVKSEQYKRYETILNYSQEKLIELTRHESPVVKVYAFNALVQKNYSKIFSIFEEHINDTSKFEVLAGCIGDTKTVNFYMFRKLEPKMTSKQKVKFNKTVSSYYSKIQWEMLRNS